MGIVSNEQKCMQARPSLEKGSVEEILDVNLLSEPCNMEINAEDGTTRPKMFCETTQTTSYNEPGVARTRRGPAFS